MISNVLKSTTTVPVLESSMPGMPLTCTRETVSGGTELASRSPTSLLILSTVWANRASSWEVTLTYIGRDSLGSTGSTLPTIICDSDSRREDEGTFATEALTPAWRVSPTCMFMVSESPPGYTNRSEKKAVHDFPRQFQFYQDIKVIKSIIWISSRLIFKFYLFVLTIAAYRLQRRQKQKPQGILPQYHLSTFSKKTWARILERLLSSNLNNQLII